LNKPDGREFESKLPEKEYRSNPVLPRAKRASQQYGLDIIFDRPFADDLQIGCHEDWPILAVQ
jgi:hypothetical protein